MLPGVAVNVTYESFKNAALHVEPHEIPAGLDVTLPDPVPAVTTDNEYLFNVNDAVTDRAAVI